jgi:F-type H+-transporting ATPase subunit a
MTKSITNSVLNIFSSFIVLVAMTALPFSVIAQAHDAHTPAATHEAAQTPATTTTPETAAPAHVEGGQDAMHTAEGHGAEAHSCEEPLLNKEGKYDPKPGIFEHIGNSNEFHLFGHFAIPLPCILWSKEDGMTFCMSNKFEHGHKAYNRYVLVSGVVQRIEDASFPSGEVAVGCIEKVMGGKDGKEEIASVDYQGKQVGLQKATTLLKGSSFIDFSISKNVFAMLLAALILVLTFTKVASLYKTRVGQAPTGIQSFIEPILVFIDAEVIKPMLGNRGPKYAPYIYTVFFFILACNLLGLVPLFPGGANITGNVGTTLVLAVFTFLITNLNGNRHYWGHIFNMPGVPLALKFLITPVEIIGIFTKPASLMIRLFANITAGHIIILNLISLIFVFGKVGTNLMGATAGTLMAIPFTLFMNIIEFVVASIQAFIFTILSASYIGAATEEHHHEEAHH